MEAVIKKFASYGPTFNTHEGVVGMDNEKAYDMMTRIKRGDEGVMFDAVRYLFNVNKNTWATKPKNAMLVDALSE